MATGRFMSIDPLAEKYNYQSPYNFAENKVTSHRELEGLEGISFQTIFNAATNPNGASAHALGVAQGLVNSAKGLVNAVRHPVQTAKGIGNTALWLAVGSQASGAVDRTLGTNSSGAGTAILNGVVSGVNNLKTGNGIQRGEVIGEIAGALVGAKGIGMATKAVSSLGKSATLLVDTSSESTNFSKILTSTSEFDPVKTLYRGTTGSEKASGIFLTDDISVAKSYILNGGQAMKYEISSSGLYQLEHSGELLLGRGINTGSTTISTEYQFIGKELVNEINKLGRPFNP